MKIKVELAKGESMQDVDEFLEKAMHKKSECSGGEKYADPALEKVLEMLCKEHADVLNTIEKEVKEFIAGYVNK